jgi:hypothetical protein
MTSHSHVAVRSRPVDSQSWLVNGIKLWALVVLSLHVAAVALPEESAWSVWAYTFVPPWLGWVLALLAASLIVPAVNQAVLRLLDRWLDRPVWRNHRRMWFAVIALLSGALFWLARLRHLQWGDSYLLSIALSYPDLELRVVYNWQAPFTVFFHQRLWQFVADPWFGWPVETVYAVVSTISGMVFVYLLLNFAARLGRNLTESIILAGLLLTTGSVQLFFGYVENYTVVSLMLLITLYLAWRASQSEVKPVWPVLALSLANAFHPSTVFLWPGMLLLVYLLWRRRDMSAAGALVQTVLPPMLIGGSVLALMESGGHGLSAFFGVDRPGGGDGIWFVPLFATTTEWQHYTMFSVAHILDWSNIHFLISPFGIPVILLCLLTIYRFQLAVLFNPADKDYALFLGLTALMYILLTWLWNPDYGGRKDWDLFAPSAFVYTLLAGYLLVRTISSRRQLQETGLLMLTVSLLHTATWIFANTYNLPRS